MDLSQVKVEVYDFLAVLVPGLLLVCELWVALRGWTTFAHSIATLTGPAFSVLLLVAFPLGSLLQESADLGIKKLKGNRYFKSIRDEIWESPTGVHIRNRIARQLGHDIENVDVAFDYCLTRVQNNFPKRNLFLANSDLARSLILINVVGTVPMLRVILDLHLTPVADTATIAVGLMALTTLASVSWARMKRFRDLSERPVFHVFLAQSLELTNSAAGGK